MPLKQRNVVIDLGEVAASTASGEVDLSSMTHCVLYMKPIGSPTTSRIVHIEFCPLPLGETADDADDWYQLYGTTATGATKMQVEWTYKSLSETTMTQVGTIPVSGLLGGVWLGWSMSIPVSPRRIRFVMPSDAGTPPGFTGNVNLMVEGMRSIG